MATMGSAFVKGWFQGALLMALALLACGLLGREWHEERERERNADPPALTVEVPRRVEVPRTRSAPRAKKADQNVRQARAWVRCSGSACYHDVRGTAGLTSTPDVNAGLP